MASETTAKQNAIIWSAAGALILILCAIIGWLINGKDTALTNSINNLIEAQTTALQKTEESDRKIMDAFNKLCDRVGSAESRIGNLEIYIQMPFAEREKYIFKQKR